MVIFIIAILLPSLILSYIGLQSIRHEQYRQEEIYLRNLEQYLSIAISRVESEDISHTITMAAAAEITGVFFPSTLKAMRNMNW